MSTQTIENNNNEQHLIRVLVVDDSVVIRNLFSRILDRDPMLKVVASVGDGQAALNILKTNEVDIVVLDIEMPVMDGITALPKLLEHDSKMKVIMASTLTTRNAKLTLEALQKGASECLSKPSSSRELATAEDFKRDLLAKVKVLGGAVRTARGLKTEAKITVAKSPEELNKIKEDKARSSSYSLKKNVRFFVPKIIAIGSSTGGPYALPTVVEKLKGLNQPIFITQHMPEKFTTVLASHLEQKSGMVCREAVDGELVTNGRIYLAPGGYHMTVFKEGTKVKIRLNQEPPEHFCRPSVEPMLRSLTSVYGSEILTVILTGMGADGVNASEVLADKGGLIMAQDKETSVVWGMPGAVAMKGICFDVLPIQNIGERIYKIAKGQV